MGLDDFGVTHGNPMVLEPARLPRLESFALALDWDSESAFRNQKGRS